ncbi:MAG: hypothetical protein GX146_02515 [Myxococcales bacterium]|jgi:hypothetical protein|nr:hypothetical protein [Myxococcales bacterium]
MTRHRIPLICLLTALYMACTANDAEWRDIDQPLPAVFVITTDFHSGSSATIDPAAFTVHRDIHFLHSDSVCRYDAAHHRMFVVQRWGADAIAVVEPTKGWRLTDEYSVGNGSNPQDIAVVASDKAYVSRLQHASLRIVNPVSGAHRGDIPLGHLADADGLPEAAHMLVRGEHVFVALQRLDATQGYRPTDHSLIAVIHHPTDTVVTALPTAMPNPSAPLRYSPALSAIVVVTTGTWSIMNPDPTPDGAIEYLDPTALTLSGPIMTEADLGGDLVDAIIVGPELGFAIVAYLGTDGPATRLVRINPEKRQVTATLLESDRWAYAAMALSPDGASLWVADRTPNAPGIRILSTDADGPSADTPLLNTGLPPQGICAAHDDTSP